MPIPLFMALPLLIPLSLAHVPTLAHEKSSSRPLKYQIRAAAESSSRDQLSKSFGGVGILFDESTGSIRYSVRDGDL